MQQNNTHTHHQAMRIISFGKSFQRRRRDRMEQRKKRTESLAGDATKWKLCIRSHDSVSRWIFGLNIGVTVWCIRVCMRCAVHSTAQCNFRNFLMATSPSASSAKRILYPSAVRPCTMHIESRWGYTLAVYTVRFNCILWKMIRYPSTTNGQNIVCFGSGKEVGGILRSQIHDKWIF